MNNNFENNSQPKEIVNLNSSPLKETADIQEHNHDRERIDNKEDILILEKKAQASKFISESYALSNLTPMERALAPFNQPMHAVSHINNQFLTKIIPCYMNNNPEKGWEDFKSIVPHTTDEELTLLVTKEEFFRMHINLKKYLYENQDKYRKAVEDRLLKRTSTLDPNIGRIEWNDRYEFQGIETPRSLENMKNGGVRISINLKEIAEVQKAYESSDNGVLPVLELVKNKNILNVNGFTSSKISLAVHDSMDHLMGFIMAEKTGLLNKFTDLFESIGNPQNTDIYKREGEALASIGFGVRYWANLENGFVPLITEKNLMEHMDSLFDHDMLNDRHLAAFKILRTLAQNPSSREAQSLGFVFSNYITELDEQRRKHGKIKQRDVQSRETVNELDPYSADYLSFFIEMHHEFLNSHNKHRDNLLMYHILLEQYLCDVASGKIDPKQELIVKVQDMKNLDFSKTTLPPNRIMWMSRNYGFSAIRDAIF